MTEQDYMDADYEVISMVNRKRGPGGELPGKLLTFIPSDRAQRVEALDLRIQQIRRILPYISFGAGCFISLMIGTMI